MPSEPSQKLTLGRLEKVDLRTYWCEEDAEFTPWLAQADNIKLLGEAIGIELRVPEELSQEPSDIPEADILCQDGSDRWVLIENQLEPTDHHHLGRLLTAMADLQANTVIWIASSFTPEHQIALHWLNQMTAPGVHFFGIEIELWRIGKAVAPKFNLVIQPQRQEAIALTEASVEILPESASSSLPESPPEPPPVILTDAQRQNLEFWRGLCHQLERRGSIIKPSQPSTESSLSFAIGRAGFRLYTRLESSCSLTQEAPDRPEAELLKPEQALTVGLMLLGEDAKPHFHLLEEDREAIESEIGIPLEKPHFHLLEEDREAIESEIGIPLEWDAQGENKSCLIYCGLAGIDLEDRDQWIEYYQWFCVYLEQFHDVFGDRIKRLNANDYQPAPDYSFNPLKSSAVLPGS